MRITGSHAIVTGASRGIGASLTRELTRRGARVTMVARSARPMAELAAQTGAAAVTLDLAADDSMYDAMQKLEAEHGAVDLLELGPGSVHQESEQRPVGRRFHLRIAGQ